MLKTDSKGFCLFLKMPMSEKIRIVNGCSRRCASLEFYVKQSIKLIGIDRFSGISEITLKDDPHAAFRDDALPNNLRHPLTDGFRAAAYYYYKTKNDPARIEVYAKEVYRGIPFPLYVTPILQLRIARTLAHELAHHLLTRKRKAYPDAKEEKISNRYASRVIRNMTGAGWLRIWQVLSNELSEWHLSFALADAKLGEIETAENGFYTAWQFNPDSTGAAEGFWDARQQLRQDPQTNDFNASA